MTVYLVNPRSLLVDWRSVKLWSRLSVARLSLGGLSLWQPFAIADPNQNKFQKHKTRG